MKQQICSIVVMILFCIGTSNIKAQALIDLETGLVSTGYNNVSIPGDKGTRFSLKDDLIPKSAFFYRIRLNYTIKSRHTISLLYAPLEIKSKGSATKDILFEGVVFPANTELTGTYKFNSYRLTYRYDIVRKRRVEFGLGLTAKIRDAKMALASAGLESEKPIWVLCPLSISGYYGIWIANSGFCSRAMHLLHLKAGPKMFR